MGNCQAIDAAALVVQHPNGRIDRMYWSVSASEVMKMYPGHYVSLIIPLSVSGEESTADGKTVRFTRVKLLRPGETLVLGRAYRLVTSQEVIKVLRAKKYAKTKKQQHQPEPESAGGDSQMDPEKQSSSCEEEAAGASELEKNSQATGNEGLRPRLGPTNCAAARLKSWRPSLQSISEGGS